MNVKLMTWTIPSLFPPGPSSFDHYWLFVVIWEVKQNESPLVSVSPSHSAFHVNIK